MLMKKAKENRNGNPTTPLGTEKKGKKMIRKTDFLCLVLKIKFLSPCII